MILTEIELDESRFPQRLKDLISVHCKSRVGMTEHMRDCFNVHALLDGQGSEAVSEIVEAYLRYSCSLLYPVQSVCD